MPAPETEIYRQEAIDHYSAGPGGGDVLRLSPSWIKWCYPLLLIFGAAGLLFLTVGRVQEYARGPAIIQFVGRTDVTAPSAATIEAVVVVVGQQVAEGEVLVNLEAAREQAELGRVEQEIEVRLSRFLREPGDAGNKQALATLRAQREFARQQLETRVLRAPHDGVVADLLVQPGQLLLPGQVAVTLRGDNSHLKVIGMIPGRYRPQLRSGMRTRLEIPGFNQAYQDLDLESVADGVVGPGEARRFLGQGVSDAVPISGPVVLVEAVLDGDVFQAGGNAYSYHHGMHAILEIQVRSDPIILALVPGLKYFLEARHD